MCLHRGVENARLQTTHLFRAKAVEKQIEARVKLRPPDVKLALQSVTKKDPKMMGATSST